MKKNMLQAQNADNSYEKRMRHWGLAESIGGLAGGTAGLVGSALTLSGHKKTGGVFTAIGGALNGIKALSGLTKSFVTRHHDKKESEKKVIGENADEQIRNRAILNKYRGKGEDAGRTDEEILARHQGEQPKKRELRHARKQLRKETMNQDAGQDAALKARQLAYKQEGHSRRKAFSTGFGTNVFGLLSAATTMTNGINGYNGVTEGGGADFAKWGGLVGAAGGLAGGAIGMAGAAEGRSKLKSKPKQRTRYGNIPANDANADADNGNAGDADANEVNGNGDADNGNGGEGNGNHLPADGNGGVDIDAMEDNDLERLMERIRRVQDDRRRNRENEARENQIRENEARDRENEDVDDYQQNRLLALADELNGQNNGPAVADEAPAAENGNPPQQEAERIPALPEVGAIQEMDGLSEAPNPADIDEAF